MKPKTMILMVVAVTCGLGASYMTSRLLAERGTTDDGDKVSVLVAKKNLDMGMLVKNPEEWFEEKQFAKGDEPKNSLASFEALKGRSLRRPLRSGDWVTEDDLLERGRIGMMGQLPEGHRAVGIRVNPESIAGGFASLPLSRVDIFATLRRGEDKHSKSILLLEDVLVLAADTNQFRDPENRATLATVVTVALRPEDITKVRLVESFGPLTLALRGFGDKKIGDLDKVQTTFQDIIMGTHGKRTDISEDPIDPFQPRVVGSTPPKPAIQPKEQPAEIARVVHRTHRVSIVKGDQQEFWEYTFDENDRVIDCRQVQPGTPGSATRQEPIEPKNP